MRVKNSLLNMAFGLSSQLVSMIMGFIVRTIFIQTLGIEYLGVDGLFSSILLMLSLANLGFDTAIIYSLYKPLAERDTRKIQALMNLYKRAYMLIGIVVMIIGLSLLPFLPHLIRGETTIPNIRLIYVLFLIHSASSYFFVYKQSIIIADQQNYKISGIHSGFVILSNSLQIVLLLASGQYLAVLITQILCRLLENMYIAHKANQWYPYIKGKNGSKLTPSERKHFFKNMYSLLLYKISGVVIHGTDNIVISAFVGVAAVGMYANYLLIMSTLTMLLDYIFYSIRASVGNLHVTEEPQKQYFIFRVLHFANFWVYGFFTILLWNVLNPFIVLWLGDQYVFDPFVVFAILLNFYTTGMQSAPTTFRDTTGMFAKGKYRPLLAAAINLIASIILVQQIGIAGVLLGTVISRICTYAWYDPYVIFKHVFFKPVTPYYLRYAGYAGLVLMTVTLTHWLGSRFEEAGTLNLAIRAGICILLPNAIFYALFRKSEEFKYICNIAKRLAGRFVLTKGEAKWELQKK